MRKIILTVLIVLTLFFTMQFSIAKTVQINSSIEIADIITDKNEYCAPDYNVILKAKVVKINGGASTPADGTKVYGYFVNPNGETIQDEMVYDTNSKLYTYSLNIYKYYNSGIVIGTWTAYAYAQNNNLYYASDRINFQVSKTCSTQNSPPVITGIGGPTSLNVNEVGKWIINAYDPDGNYLYYSVDWGDALIVPERATAASSQTSTLEHTYTNAGTYTIIFTVSDSQEASTQASITVKVLGVVNPTTYWTEWKDRDDPSGTGDWEHKQDFPDVCDKPIAVECKTLNGVDFMDAGQDVICNTAEGFVCYNNLNDNNCKDYKVRFLCAVNDVAPKTPAEIPCKDYDGGVNENVRSTIKGLASWGPGLQAEVMKDHCRLPEYANEFFCNDAGYVDQKSIFCKNGCKDGMCQSATPPSAQVCGNEFKEGSEQCDNRDLGFKTTMQLLIETDNPKTVNFNGNNYLIYYLGYNTDDSTILIRINNQTKTLGLKENYVIAGVTVSFTEFYPKKTMITLKANPRTCTDEGYGSGELKCTNQCQYDYSSCQNIISVNDSWTAFFKVALDENALTSDISLALDILNRLNPPPIVVGTTVLFKDLNGFDLDHKITLAIYNGKAIIITGSNSPQNQLIFSKTVRRILDDEGILILKSIKSNEITQQNIRYLFNDVVCGNRICEAGEADVCAVCTSEICPSVPCQAGSCPRDCGSSTEVQAFLNEKVKLNPGMIANYDKENIEIRYNGITSYTCPALSNGEERSDTAVESIVERNKNCKPTASFTVVYTDDAPVDTMKVTANTDESRYKVGDTILVTARVQDKSLTDAKIIQETEITPDQAINAVVYFVAPSGELTKFQMEQALQVVDAAPVYKFIYEATEIDQDAEKGLWTIYVVASKGSTRVSSEKIYFKILENRAVIDVVEDSAITANAIAESQTKFNINLMDGEAYKLGNYILTLNDLEGETAVIIMQKSSREYEYICAPGCKEVEDGCLCPKIRVIKTLKGYDIDTGSGQIEAKEIKINPGADKIVAVLENDGEQDVGLSNLEEGIDIVTYNNKKVKITTNRQKLETYITDDLDSAKTRITIRGNYRGLIAETSSGDKEVKVLPSEASNTAQEAMTASYTEMELKDSDDGLIYELDGAKSVKILGFIPVESKVSTTIDAGSGAVIDINKPWYSAISTE